MPQRLTRLFVFCSLFVATVCCEQGLAPAARADVLVLINGTSLNGEVEAEDERSIRFRFDLNGIWTSRTFSREDVRDIYRVEGDQSDRAPDDDHRGPAEDAVNPVVVIPLRGIVGGYLNDSVKGTFDHRLLEAALDEADGLGAAAVILAIDSPGGWPDDQELLCETILRRRDLVRIVAFVEDALDDAFLIPMCCREVIMSPGGRLGAAPVQVFDFGDDPPDPAESRARCHELMQDAGREPLVWDACRLETDVALYWSRRAGFSTDEPTEEESLDWRMVDDDRTRLTVSSTNATRWGLADAVRPSFRQSLTALGFDKDHPIVVLDKFVALEREEVDRQIELYIEKLTTYFQSILRFVDAATAWFEALGGGDQALLAERRQVMSRSLTGIIRTRESLRRRATQMQRSGTVIDEPLIRRLDDDERRFRSAQFAVRAGSENGASKLIEEFDTVVKEWQELLK